MWTCFNMFIRSLLWFKTALHDVKLLLSLIFIQFLKHNTIEILQKVLNLHCNCKQLLQQLTLRVRYIHNNKHNISC